MLPKQLKKLVVCHERVDFRKQWNGLLAEAQKLGFSPYEGNLVVFVKRDKRQFRALTGDDKGLYLFSRRFEGGCFSFDFTGGSKTITRQNLNKGFNVIVA